MSTPLAAILAGLLGAAAGALANPVAYRLEGACGRRPTREAIVTVLTAVLAAAVVAARHAWLDRALGVALLFVLVPVSLVDLDVRKIPNRITGPAAVLAVIIGLAIKPSGLPGQMIGGAAGFAFLFVFALAYPRGLGMGDVKLAGVLGLYLAGAVAVALFAGVLIGAVVGLGVMARVGVAEGRKTGLPFGPFLAAGGLIGILAGHPIAHWYVHTFIH
jgi:leader peptidase (prepilin peptidase)/N-methyltransferase